ncbi:MAG TPA: gliding motility lipoprotein GldB [Salinimicrobium sp.]|nr:gliding motility lipoprotein GldB [Salinimicrobium sp.]
MIKKISVVLLCVFIFSCEKQSDVEKEIEQIDVAVEVLRFDQEFAEADSSDLKNLKGKYPYLFPEQFHDSVWVSQMNDPIQFELDTAVTNAFKDFSKQKDDLHSLFQHLKYFFPEFKSPTVVTITSEVDYTNKVIVADSLLLISLDTYLGKGHPFYIGIQDFLKKNFEPSQLIPDVAEAYAKQLVPKPNARTFLSSMIYYGKILYLKDLLIPSNSDAEKIGYTEEEIKWARENEEEIWRYFVENEVLFDTNTDLHRRFLNPGPFSKFYLQLDAESPDRIGWYIGWQIVRKYMEDNDVSTRQLLIMDSEHIFNKANYKPAK